MTTYANTHFALENLRSVAAEEDSVGPRVLVIGPENAGKTTLVKLLSAYASRSERQPVVVNLDPKEGLLSIPGTLSTIVLDSVIDVEQGWGSSPMNGPSPVPVKLPLVYYYGLEDPESQVRFYKPIVTRLALSVMSRLEEDIEAKPSGCIIDTSGSISLGKGGYDIIRHVVAEFSGALLRFVVPSNRLYANQSSQCLDCAWLGAAVQRHVPSLCQAVAQCSRFRVCHQARQVRRLRGPRQRVHAAVPASPDSRILLRRCQDSAEPAYTAARFQRTRDLPVC